MVQSVFPSPYGVTVIKSDKIINIKGTASKFPSPYGVTVFKSIVEFVKKNNAAEFPSPYGVTVIKSKAVNYGTSTKYASFRPLTG